MDKPIPEAAIIPCPMCGGDAALNTCRTTDSEFIRLNGRDTGYGVNCVTCGLNNRGFAYGYATPAEAITAWNRRALTAAQQQGQAVACPHCKGNPGLDCNSFGRTAPPSAQQDGGEGVIACDCGASQDNRWPHHDECSVFTAPPSAPVGVEWTDERIIAVCKAAGVRWIEADEEEGGFPGGFDITHMPEMRRLFTALAQQPASVDEAMTQRIMSEFHANDPGDVWPPAEQGRLRRKALQDAINNALATQHQEPTT